MRQTEVTLVPLMDFVAEVKNLWWVVFGGRADVAQNLKDFVLRHR